jgi:osmotically-inducible protein OsmY
LTITPGEGDEAVALEVADDISASVYFSIFDDVNIHVADGIVTLTGYVTSPDKSREFTAVTSRVPGVQQVVNSIEALPASMMDDDLRYAIATAIYNSPMFSVYATQRTGPVHIVVLNGHVTLTGVVGSDAERNAAAMLASGAFGVMGVENHLRVEKP